MRKTSLAILAMAIMMLSGCTTPVYERTIVRIYDADMKLKEIHEIERITQQDPQERSLHPELQKQNYKLPSR